MVSREGEEDDTGHRIGLPDNLGMELCVYLGEGLACMALKGSLEVYGESLWEPRGVAAWVACSVLRACVPAKHKSSLPVPRQVREEKQSCALLLWVPGHQAF